jgi:hypothetical protein
MPAAFTPSNPNVMSTAGFWSDTFDADPLVASETVSISALLSSGQGILKRGQVLCGWAPNAARNVALSTTGSACAILAQDIDTGTGAAVTGLVYVQGKFLVTGLTASGNGLEIDSAELWLVGIYILTVMQESGKLVPWRSFPNTPGVPLPVEMTPEEAERANKEQVDAIKAAIDAFHPGMPGVPEPPIERPRRHDPAWAVAAFGEREATREEAARDKAAENALDLRQKHHKALDELTAKHAKDLAELHRKQHEERAAAAKQADDSLKQARPQGNGPTPPTPPVQPPPAPKK